MLRFADARSLLLGKSFFGSRVTALGVFFSVLSVSTGCNKNTKVEYEQYNAPDDYLTIVVGSEDLLDPIEIPLMSSTGQVEVGRARVDPGGGPIGTNHEIVVEVYDAYQDVVDRTSVRTRSPGHHVDEFDLVQDSADEGVYLVALETVGEDDELRDDQLTFRLWTIIESTEEQ